jgi:hypothetical protein
MDRSDFVVYPRAAGLFVVRFLASWDNLHYFVSLPARFSHFT